MSLHLSKRTILVFFATVAALAAGAAIARAAVATGEDPPSSPPRGEAFLADINAAIAADPNKSEGIGQVTREAKGVFASTAGDPVDVDLLAGKGNFRCVSVSGVGYSSSVSCFDINDAAKDGSYQLVLPESSDASPLVIGFMPSGKSRATVSAGGVAAQSIVHGRLFMGSLPAGALGADNAAKFGVAFG